MLKNNSLTFPNNNFFFFNDAGRGGARAAFDVVRLSTNAQQRV